jgi:hypothetical protein
MPHEGHDNHICEMMKNKAKYEEVKALIKPAKFICKGCGRAAAKAINLCDPEPL